MDTQVLELHKKIEALKGRFAKRKRDLEKFPAYTIENYPYKDRKGNFLYVAGTPNRKNPRLVFITRNRDVARRGYMKYTGIHKAGVRACRLENYESANWK